jgi:ABC-type transporter Mla subunit MlaD
MMAYHNYHHSMEQFELITNRAKLEKKVSLIGYALADHIMAIVDDFYHDLLKNDQMNAMFSNSDHLDLLKKAHLNHWEHVFQKGMDDNYPDTVMAIYDVHQKLHLSKEWFALECQGILDRMSTFVNHYHRFNPFKKFHAIHALTQIMIFDIAIIMANGSNEQPIIPTIQIPVKPLETHINNNSQFCIHDDQLNLETNQFLDQLGSSIEDVDRLVKQVLISIDETKKDAGTMLATADQTSSNIQSVSFASQQLLVSISEISEQVENSAQITQKAAIEARHTNETVEGLSSAASRIGEIVKIINTIAEQTNLLALNATIEAARAGEAGKGFSVVADEVKNLATQTGQATEEITSQINEVQSVTSQAVEAIRHISQTISQMNEIARKISEAVKHQQKATDAIAKNVEKVSQTTQEVSHTILKVSKSAQEISTESFKVSSSVLGLVDQVNALKNFFKALIKPQKRL